MAHLGIGRLGPDPCLLGEQGAHGIDIAMVGRAVDDALLAGCRAQHLHKKHPRAARWLEPLVQLLGVVEPVLRVNCSLRLSL